MAPQAISPTTVVPRKYHVRGGRRAAIAGGAGISSDDIGNLRALVAPERYPVQHRHGSGPQRPRSSSAQHTGIADTANNPNNVSRSIVVNLCGFAPIATGVVCERHACTHSTADRGDRALA